MALVKESTDDYFIIAGQVNFIMTKKFSFDANCPYRIQEFFHNINMNTCLIEIRIYNQTAYTITIQDIFLTKKNNKIDEKIKMLQNLEDIKKVHNRNNLSESKYLSLQTDEQITVVFKIDNPDIIHDIDVFKLSIKWLSYFDLMTKTYEHEFNNGLNIYNNYFKIKVIEKPEKDIIVNQNFKIVMNLTTKNPNIKYSISLCQDILKENDKSNDREIEIIDIIEKKIELNSKNPSSNFAMICKSDVIGNVHLPKLKFIIFEGNKMNPIEYVYDALINFNCVKNE